MNSQSDLIMSDRMNCCCGGGRICPSHGDTTPEERQSSSAPIRSTDRLERKGIFLQIDYQRISPNDKTGMVDVTSEGDEAWVYADVGSHHGAQCENSDVEKRVMVFGSKLSALVKEHFGAVMPILNEEPGRSKRVRSNND